MPATGRAWTRADDLAALAEERALFKGRPSFRSDPDDERERLEEMGLRRPAWMVMEHV